MALLAQKSFQQAIIITLNGSWYCAFLDAKLKIITDNKTKPEKSSQDKHELNTHQRAMAHHRMSS